MLKKFKIASQVIFFLLFAFFFFFFNFLRTEGVSSGLAWFLRLNPFVTLITSVASRSIIVPYVVLGIIMTVATIFFGRFFCGMICPLGSIIDFSDKIFKSKITLKQPLRPSVKLQQLKYVLMVIFIVLAVLGLTFPLFMDPLLMTTRFFTFFIRPAVMMIMGLFGINTDNIAVSTHLAKGAFVGAFATFALFALILAGALFDRRFWCQYVCPSGAFFGIMSRFSLFTRKINVHTCNTCGLCTKRSCPTRAISGEKYEKTSTAECILCGTCSADKRLCSTFSFGRTKESPTHGPDIERRHVIAGLSSGLLLAPIFANNPVRGKPSIPGPIRPPGAVEENDFLARCITCGACISVCPQKALHPGTLAKDGLLSWNTPTLVPRIGYCDTDCTRCSEACPTGALLPLTRDQKQKTKIGTAVIFRSECRAWQQELPCMICANKCPYEAIETKMIKVRGKDWKLPVVDKRKCIGCGICEYWCPEQHETAIKVYSFGDRRIKVHTKKKRRKA